MTATVGTAGAVGIHASRFGRRRVVSLVTLACADQRVIVGQGVATLTTVPSRLALVAGAVASTVSIGVVLAAGLVAEHLATAVTAGVGVGVLVLWSVLILDRHLRARRMWPGDTGAWVLADVAAVRGAGAGEHVMGEVTRRADAASRPLVLAVRTGAERARALYVAHGFEVVPPSGRDPFHSPVWARSVTESATHRAQFVRMRRASAGRGRRSALRPATAAVGLAVAALLLVLGWPSPVTWLVLPGAALLSAAAMVDIEQRRVPNALTAAGFIGLLGIVALLQLETGEHLVGPALAGAALFAGPLFLMHVVTAARTPGLGDVKLAASAGLLCGAFDARLALPALAACCLIGAAMGAVWQRRAGRRGFPLAPAIGLGTAVALAAGALCDWLPT